MGNLTGAYLKYRKEKVIRKGYLDGARMCLQYTKKEEDKKFIYKLIRYYENLENAGFINFHILKYFKFLAGKNLAKKMIKEMVIFHFPAIGYLSYRFIG